MFEIRGATLPDGSKDTLLIGGEKIIVKNKDCRYAQNWIDGEGLLALPGLIDPHVHFRVPGYSHKEDWEHGARAAIAGGVTTVFDMPNTNPPLTTAKRLEKKSDLVGERDINYRFWFGATGRNASEIKKVAGDPRVIGVKVYMGSSTGNLLVTDEAVLEKIFRVCAENNLIVGVHAECEARMKNNRTYLGYEPQVSDHCRIRDPEAEWWAVHQALRLQRKTGCRLYFCHLSTSTAVEIAAESKNAGARVYIEVCPHHLWMDDGMLFGAGPSKNFYKMNPPLREKRRHVEKLRQYVCEGLVDTIGSDHAPHTREEKMRERYDDIPSGVPGIETTLPLIFQFVRDGKMSITRFVEITSANAAKIFGLEHKGKIEVGYDADIVLLDPNKEVPFRHQDMETKCAWTPFIGMSGMGAVRFVILRGKVVKAGEKYPHRL
jgi:dihydroorotase